LRNADNCFGMGKSDPYCTCQVVGTTQRSSKMKTRVINDDLNPVWNHTQTIIGDLGDSLLFQVYDDDPGPVDGFLGKVTHIVAAKSFDGNLNLEDAGKGISASLQVKVEQVIIADPSELNRLTNVNISNEEDSVRSVNVTIVHARGLRNADHGFGMGKSDPFCTCIVAGKSGSSRIQTRVIRDDLNPVWNHSQTVRGNVGDELLFNVFDEDPGPMKDLLGKVTHIVTDEPFEGELELQEAGTGITATLYVKVYVLEDV